MGPGVTVTQKGLPEGRGLQWEGSLGFLGGLAWLEEGAHLGKVTRIQASRHSSLPVTTVLEPSEGHSHPRSRALRGRGAVV